MSYLDREMDTWEYFDHSALELGFEYLAVAQGAFECVD